MSIGRDYLVFQLEQTKKVFNTEYDKQAREAYEDLYRLYLEANKLCLQEGVE